MEDNNKTQNQAIVIIGLIVLIVALFLGVKLVFAGLDAAIPDLDQMGAQNSVSTSQSVQTVGPADSAGETDAPAFCTHCGKEMRDGFQWGQYCPYCGKQVE